MEILPVRASFFHEDVGQTVTRSDMTKLIVAFRNFEDEPKNERQYLTVDFILYFR